MKYAIGVAVAGLILLCAFLYLTPDLRGWTPADFSDLATVVEPTQAGNAAFTISDCLPGTVDPWTIPAAIDGQQFDSQSMLTCRSLSSALWAVGMYLLATAAGLLFYRRCYKISKVA